MNSPNTTSFRHVILIGVVAGLLVAGFHDNAQATTFTNGNFATYGQVDWTDNTNAVAILDDNYNTVFASSGGILEIGSSTGFTVEFSGASALAAYLPDGGPLGALDADLLDPTSTPAGAFGGNVTALVLDIDFSDAGVLRGNLGIPFGDLVLTNFTGLPQLNGLTVRQFSAVVNTLLGGGSGSYTIDELNPILLDIDGSFDAGIVSAFATTNLTIGLPTNGPTNDWINAVGAKWETASNWSMTSTPSVLQFAVIITNGLGNPPPFRLITNDQTTATTAPGSMTINNFFIAGRGILANLPGVRNELLLSNTGSTTLNILNSLSLSNRGYIVITNSILQVGGVANDDGEVEMVTGSILTTNAPVNVGVTGSGEWVTSPGTWLARNVTVGNAGGSAGVVVLAGGTTTLLGSGTGLDIAAGAGSAGTVQLIGGMLITTNNTTLVGDGGTGTLLVTNATWLAQSVMVGRLAGSQGTLTVGGGTSCVYSNLTIGSSDCSGTGTVVVTGGSLFVTNASHTAVLDVRSGSLLFDAGTLVVDQLVTTNGCGSFQQIGGTLVVGGVTNPFFRVTAISREGSNVRVTWQTLGGETNVLQAVNSGPGESYNTNFVDLATQIIVAGVGLTTTNSLDVGGATNKPARYYRVRLVP